MATEISIRHKGQITLPADVRSEYGLEVGGKLILFRRPGEIVLVKPEDITDPTAGALAQYAYTRNPDAAEERRWVAQYIAETADSYDE